MSSPGARMALWALLLLACSGPPLVAAGPVCSNTITNYSATFGKRDTTKLERFSNQTSQWLAKGPITKVNAYYNPSSKCVVGVKITYGSLTSNALLLGMEGAALITRDLTLASGEGFNKVQVKAESCVQYLRLVTNQGHQLVIGDDASTSTLLTSYPAKTTGFVGAIRGYEEYTMGAGTATTRGPMRTLQLVWADCYCNCTSTGASSASPLPSPLPSPSPSPSPLPVPVPSPSPSPSPAPSTSTAASSGVCPSSTDMCSPNATATSAAYCPAVSPFTKAACIGGCCFSSGKCVSSSCAISGIGKEVANTVCYGLNPAGAVGVASQCAGLACKLAVPGCNTNLLGGACVGTVTDLSGQLFLTNPAGAAMVGYPCLDVTPYDKTINASGAESTSGAYVAKLWTVCDCRAAPTVGSDIADATSNAANSAGATSAGLLRPIMGLGKLNFTDLVSLVNDVEDAATHPLWTALSVVKLPALVLPNLPKPNVTKALTFLGSLVHRGDAAKAATAAAADATPTGALLNLVRGASTLATATQSSNPLGSLLGALAPKTANGTVNPLLGLRNLVDALVPGGADSTEKADLLSGLLDALNGGTTAAPSAELVGAVAKLLGGGSGTGPAASLPSLLKAFTIPANSTSLLSAVKAAVTQGQTAATGGVDLPGIFSKLKAFTSPSTGSTTSSPLKLIVSGVEALTGIGGGGGTATAAASTPAVKAVLLLAKLAGVDTSSTSTLQGVLNLYTKLAPVLQSLGGATQSSSSESSALGLLSSVLSTVAGGTGSGGGLDLSTLSSLAGKVSPLLQALGGTATTPTPTTSTAAATNTTSAAASNSVGTLLKAFGLGGSSGGVAGIRLSDVSELLDVASQVTPVLQALAGTGGTGGTASLMNGLTSLLSTL